MFDDFDLGFSPEDYEMEYFVQEDYIDNEWVQCNGSTAASKPANQSSNL